MDVTQGISAAAIALIILVTVVWYTNRSRYRRLGSMIPGPRGLPLLGVLLEAVARRENIMDYAKELRARYGAVCKAWVGMHLVVGVTDPADVAEILNNSGWTLKKPAILRGIPCSRPETRSWRKLRRIVNPAFARKVVESHVGTFCDKSRPMADRLGRHSDGQAFSAVDHTLPCALDMLSETSLGAPTDFRGNNKQHRVTANFPNIFNILARMISTPFYCFDPERFNKENSIGRPSCSFIPFASGPKMCLGRKYTYMAVKTMLSVVLRRYQVLEYGSQGSTL
ncbi:cytochrome P450 4g15-like [Bacillus rossius redtenbacheri]|uniref:cytochrome P450 4g15-like n=1 Tax=Bacillus rossius redtenbacheri TaxID=93214 RepID=UPI002FDDC616